MPRIFPQSQDLKQIIQQHGWSLYDIAPSPARVEPWEWREINGFEPAKEYKIWNILKVGNNRTSFPTLVYTKVINLQEK